MIGLPKLAQMLDEGAWLEVYYYSELEKRRTLERGPIEISVMLEFDPSLAMSQSCKLPPRSKRKWDLGMKILCPLDDTCSVH